MTLSFSSSHSYTHRNAISSASTSWKADPAPHHKPSGGGTRGGAGSFPRAHSPEMMSSKQMLMVYVNMMVIKTMMKRCFRAPQGGWLCVLLLFTVTVIRGCSGHLLGRGLRCYAPCHVQGTPAGGSWGGHPVSAEAWVLSGQSSRVAPCASPLSPTAA